MKTLLRSALLTVRDALNPFRNFREVAILCYHSISDTEVSTAVSSRAFEAQLAHLEKSGYAFVSLGAVLDWREGKEILSRKAIALTFDDGYADFETAALPLLEKFNAPATLFLMGDPARSRIALRNDIPLLAPDALERVRNHRLVALGYHSMTHAALSNLTGEALASEMTPTFPTPYFAYPGGNYSREARALAPALGYRAAFSIKRHLVTQKSDAYLLPRSVITRDMSLRTVRFHASRALEWYRALGNLR